jgi:uncharacterized NAD(P)/FAD-binding protein YdhS
VTKKDGRNGDPLRLVVIGGGFTGAVFVIHAIRATSRALDIVVVEPLAELGRGAAYGTDDPAHRINVPSDRMALSGDEPGEATRWFFEHGFLPDAHSDDGQGQFYVSRQAYGAFVSDVLRKTLDSAEGRAGLRHLRTNATAVARCGDGWRVSTQDGGRIEADIVALCFGHAAPASPCPIGDDVRRSPKFAPDPWARKALSEIDPSDSVLVVGTGLTMADVVASLQATGRLGAVTAISRRGLTPRAHGQFLTDVDLFAGAPPPRTALGLLRLLRRRIREADPSLGWHPFIDSLRFKLPVVWNGLSASEKRRVLRRLLPFWDVHRFRIAPQVSAVLDRSRQAGRLSIEKAGLAGLGHRDGRFVAVLRRPEGRTEERAFDAVVLCTGPDKDIRTNPLIASLLAEGMARLDEAGLGLAVDLASRVVDAQGRPYPSLLALGPMTRGSFGEMTGAPDIAKHVEQITRDLFDENATPGGNA